MIYNGFSMFGTVMQDPKGSQTTGERFTNGIAVK